MKFTRLHLFNELNWENKVVKLFLKKRIAGHKICLALNLIKIKRKCLIYKVVVDNSCGSEHKKHNKYYIQNKSLLTKKIEKNTPAIATRDLNKREQTERNYTIIYAKKWKGAQRNRR